MQRWRGTFHMITELWSWVSRTVLWNILKNLTVILQETGRELSEKGVLQLFTMLSGKKEEEVKRYFRRSLKRRGKAKLIVNTDKNFSLIYKFNKGQLIIGFHFGVWNINGFPQHTWTKTLLLLIHVVPAVEGWLSCYVSTSCLRIKFLCPGENKWSRIVILISIDLGINHHWFIKRREKE